MSTFILKENTEEIRNKIEQSGIDVCVCCKFIDACWLDYSTNVSNGVHGVGYWGEDNFTHSQQEELDLYLSEVQDPIWCKDVDEFIERIKERQLPTTEVVGLHA